MIGEVGVEIFRTFESVPDLCKLRTADVVFEDLLGHSILNYESTTVSIRLS